MAFADSSLLSASAAGSPAPRRRRDAGLWSLSFCIAAGLHVAVAAALLLRPQSTAEIPGSETVVMIDLAPVPVASTDVPVDAPSHEEAMQDEPEPLEQTHEMTPAEPETPVEQPVQSVVELPVPKPVPEPPKPAVPERKKPPQKRAARAPAAAEHHAPRAAAPTQGAVANAASAASWRAQLVAHLQRYKRYPADARGSRQEGVTVLSFSINREGQVLTSGIARGSGIASLDSETLAMIRRAQPLPQPPSDVPGGRFQFSVPIRYNLQ